MARFQSILSVFSIFLLAWCFVHFTTYYEEAGREFREHDLDASVNYAVDAAVEEMLISTVDLKLDYADFEYVSVDPEIALQTYCEVLLDNLGYAVTDENIQMIKANNTPAFIVCAYDGYYVGQPTRITDVGTYDLLFSEKKPYMYYDEANDVVYSLNLGGKDCKAIRNGVITKEKVPLSSEDCWQKINAQVTADFMKAVYDNNRGQVDMLSNIIVPGEQTIVSRTNPVKTPTVFAYVNNLYLAPGKPIESFAIGGARLSHTDFVGGYSRTVDGVTRKYYCPTRLKPAGITFDKIFEKPEYAAQEGYYCDVRYME